MYTLERISSLDSGFMMKQQPKKGAAFEKHLRYAYEVNRSFPHDSAEFSPAAKFLQKIKWQLKSLKKSSDDHLQFHFIVDEIEIFTEIDEHHMFMPGKQHFRICDYYRNDLRHIQATLLAGVERLEALSYDEYQIQPLSALKMFFDRAVTDAIVHPLPFSALPEYAWSEGINRALRVELVNILVGVMAVAEKAFNLPAPKKGSPAEDESVIVLEKLLINEFNK